MTVSLVQGPVGGPDTNNVITGTTAGNRLLVFIRYAAGSIGGNAYGGFLLPGQTFTTCVEKWHETNFSGFQYHYWALSDPLVSGGDKTVGAVTSKGKSEIFEVSPCFMDSVASYQATAVSDPSTNITTLTNNCAVFAACSFSHADPTAGAGYTGAQLTNQLNFDFSEYDLDIGSAGVHAVPFSTGGTSGTVAIITAVGLGWQRPQPQVMVIN